MPTYDDIYKILVVGDSGVGKTCMELRFVDGSYTNFHYATIGIDFKFKNIELNDKTIKLYICDTAGQERFESLTSKYYRDAMGAMFVYDITSAESFVNINRWFANVRERTDSNVEFILVGNKCDLDGKRQVPREHGERLAAEYGLKFMETSARTNVNIDEAFLTLARNIFPKRTIKANFESTSWNEEPKIKLDGKKSNKKSSKCGC